MKTRMRAFLDIRLELVFGRVRLLLRVSTLVQSSDIFVNL